MQGADFALQGLRGYTSTMTNNNRREKLNVKLSPAEVEQVRQAAEKRGMMVSHYVRKRLGLPLPQIGRPPAEAAGK